MSCSPGVGGAWGAGAGSPEPLGLLRAQAGYPPEHWALPARRQAHSPPALVKPAGHRQAESPSWSRGLQGQSSRPVKSTNRPSPLTALKSSPSKKGRSALLAVKPLGPTAAFSASQIPTEREDAQYDLRGARSYPTLEDEGDWPDAVGLLGHGHPSSASAERAVARTSTGCHSHRDKRHRQDKTWCPGQDPLARVKESRWEG